MPHLSYSVTEHYSAKQMYDLVNDVDAYPKFVPDCVNSGVLQRQEHQMTAFIEVEKLGFKKRFTTKNSLTESSEILMQLIDGPFSDLVGRWTFTSIDEHSCKIEFNLRFEFKNKLMEIAFSPIFKEIVTGMVNAFSQRAKQVYT